MRLDIVVWNKILSDSIIYRVKNLGGRGDECLLKLCQRDFPGGTVDKNLPTNAGDMGSIPGPGRFCMPRNNEADASQLLSLCSRCVLQLLKLMHPSTRVPQEENSAQGEACALQ